MPTIAPPPKVVTNDPSSVPSKMPIIAPIIDNNLKNIVDAWDDGGKGRKVIKKKYGLVRD